MHAWELYGFDSENEFQENKLVIFKDNVDQPGNPKVPITEKTINEGPIKRYMSKEQWYASSESEVDVHENEKIEIVDPVVRKQLHRKCKK